VDNPNGKPSTDKTISVGRCWATRFVVLSRINATRIR